METNFKIGTRIQTMREYSGVPKFTEGMIIDDYGTGMTVAWDLPDRPIPKNKTPEEISKMYAVNPECPLRDGFDKETELSELVLIVPNSNPHPLKQLNGCINTYKGIKFNLINPEPQDVHIEDIAKGLAYKAHFSGQTPVYFSIAEHCMLVCDLIQKSDVQDKDILLKVALLHDASEAYIGDMVKPLKVHLPDFCKVEDLIQKAVFDRFDLDIDLLPSIKHFDNLSQDMEFQWFYKNEQMCFKTLSPDDAYVMFLNYFYMYFNND